MLPRLGVNIDHFATLRQLRGTPYPDLLDIARRVEKAGAQQITVHLREDRRHIQDFDVIALKRLLTIALNLEMAVAEPIVKFAVKHRPTWACLVPEKRQEVTTEGGLDVKKQEKRVGKVVAQLKKAAIKVSLFIEPDLKAVALAAKLGADAVEIHTGKFANLTQAAKRNEVAIERERQRILNACKKAHELKIHAHAGHGLDYKNIRDLAFETKDGGVLPLIEEFNIGHSIVCQSTLVGVTQAVREMLSAMHAP